VRRLRLALLASLALPLAACASGPNAGSSSEGGAAVVPKSAPFLIRLDTSFDSPQWTALNVLLKKFPDGDKLFAGFAGDNVDFDRDVKPALGPELDLVALTGADLEQKNGNFIGLTRPKDEAKFDALLAKDREHQVSEEIAGWRVFADKRATIDRFKQARNGGTLSDSARYKAAAKSLPPGTIASVYVDGPALQREFAKRARTSTGSATVPPAGPVPGLGRVGWLTAALTAEQRGFGLDLHVQGDELEVSPYTPELPAELPADVSLLVDVKGLDATLDEAKRSPGISKQLGPAEKALGGLLDEVIALFKNEAAFVVRQAPDGKSELSLVLKVTDEESAQSTVDRLATLAGAVSQKPPEHVRVAGVSAQKLTLGKTSVYYAIFDGKLVVTNDEDGISSLRQGTTRLVDSLAWRSAADAAGLPDRAAGLFYANVPKLLPLIERLSQSGENGKPLSDKVKRNLAPLSTAILYGSVDGDVLSLKGFVSVR
jgi:hypothetical protein